MNYLKQKNTISAYLSVIGTSLKMISIVNILPFKNKNNWHIKL